MAVGDYRVVDAEHRVTFEGDDRCPKCKDNEEIFCTYSFDIELEANPRAIMCNQCRSWPNSRYTTCCPDLDDLQSKLPRELHHRITLESSRRRAASAKNRTSAPRHVDEKSDQSNGRRKRQSVSTEDDSDGEESNDHAATRPKLYPGLAHKVTGLNRSTSVIHRPYRENNIAQQGDPVRRAADVMWARFSKKTIEDASISDNTIVASNVAQPVQVEAAPNVTSTLSTSLHKRRDENTVTNTFKSNNNNASVPERPIAETNNRQAMQAGLCSEVTSTSSTSMKLPQVVQISLREHDQLAIHHYIERIVAETNTVSNSNASTSARQLQEYLHSIGII